VAVTAHPVTVLFRRLPRAAGATRRRGRARLRLSGASDRERLAHAAEMRGIVAEAKTAPGPLPSKDQASCLAGKLAGTAQRHVPRALAGRRAWRRAHRGAHQANRVSPLPASAVHLGDRRMSLARLTGIQSGEPGFDPAAATAKAPGERLLPRPTPPDTPWQLPRVQLRRRARSRCGGQRARRASCGPVPRRTAPCRRVSRPAPTRVPSRRPGPRAAVPAPNAAAGSTPVQPVRVPPRHAVAGRGTQVVTGARQT
jgi:hypothetical protein